MHCLHPSIPFLKGQGERKIAFFVNIESNSPPPISCLSAEQRCHAFLEFLPDPVFVFNLDNTVSYLNPAFEKVFGWSLAELEGKIVPFVPVSAKEQTRLGIEKLCREKAIHGFKTQRLTRDGRLLDIVVDGAIFYGDQDRPAGQVITLRDVTQEKRVARINQALFRIANSLYQFRRLEDRHGVHHQGSPGPAGGQGRFGHPAG